MLYIETMLYICTLSIVSQLHFVVGRKVFQIGSNKPTQPNQTKPNCAVRNRICFCLSAMTQYLWKPLGNYQWKGSQAWPGQAWLAKSCKEVGFPKSQGPSQLYLYSIRISSKLNQYSSSAQLEASYAVRAGNWFFSYSIFQMLMSNNV